MNGSRLCCYRQPFEGDQGKRFGALGLKMLPLPLYYHILMCHLYIRLLATVFMAEFAWL